MTRDFPNALGEPGGWKGDTGEKEYLNEVFCDSPGSMTKLLWHRQLRVERAMGGS
jgi:hypothetical protein